MLAASYVQYGMGRMPSYESTPQEDPPLSLGLVYPNEDVVLSRMNTNESTTSDKRVLLLLL